MKVLILGGTGAMGVYLVNLLANDGIETIVTSRAIKKSSGNIRYIHGNAQDLDFLKSILDDNWDAIIDFMVYDTSGFQERVNLLLNATAQYIFLSSARVYADSNQPIKETSSRLLDVSTDIEFLLTDEYALSKARQENILYSSEQKNWTIIRPYITYGENRFQLGVLEKEEWLYRSLHGRTIVFSSDIAPKFTTMTYGFDVSNGIRTIVGNNSALGNTYNITTEESLTWNEVLNIYLEVLEKLLGYRPKVLLQSMDKFYDCHPAKYQIEYDRLFNRQFDNSKMEQYLKKNSFTKIDAGLKMCLAEFLKKPKFNDINWKAEALKDRHSKEHTLLKEIPGFKNVIRYLIIRYFYNAYMIIKKLKV